MHHRDGFPSSVEIARVRHRLTCGETLEDIASSLGRRVEVLTRHLAKDPPVHPQQPSTTLKLTLPNGARIEGLTLTELIRLARAL